MTDSELLTKIEIPEFALIALVGASGAGKSLFAAKHFAPTEVISSDRSRGMIADDENDQTVSDEAFELVHFIAAQRLKLRRLAVIDATNVQQKGRASLVEVARRYHALPIAIVFDLDPKICHEHNAGRPDRDLGEHVVRRQTRDLRRSIKSLRREGFRQVFVLRSRAQIDLVTIERARLWVDKREEAGPFDIIGDIHGCAEELQLLLNKLGYGVTRQGREFQVIPPPGRRAIFLGDLVDRGPASPDVLRLVMSLVESGAALAVPGNHDNKLVRALEGRKVQQTHGLAETLEQLRAEPDAFQDRAQRFLRGLIGHYVLDDGRLCVAHAGMPERMQNRSSPKVRDFALYAETTGETDEYGLPQRVDWSRDYRGRASVVYGHTPVVASEWVNNTINIDTGCVFGGKLTALRYPERELVSVDAVKTHYEPVKPPIDRGSSERGEGILDLKDVLAGGVQTRLRGRVAIREDNSAAALEVMSRFAIDPRWLVYLPPTMSPCATSARADMLEHPDQAFSYYLSEGVASVVCEEKHMGSRMVAVICRDPSIAAARFADDGRQGVLFTRTGRGFFDDQETERVIVERLVRAAEDAGVWDQLETGWMVIDCELLPWSIKAQALIDRQYAPVGAAAAHDLGAAATIVERAAMRGLEVNELKSSLERRRDAVARYRKAYAAYSWSIESAADLKVAPFHVLASESGAHVDRPHTWHLELIDRLCEADGGIKRTDRRWLDLTDESARAEAIEWWTELVETGLEGMVVKPEEFLAKGKRGFAQPGVKCRGPEYLRIIYGPEYDLDGNLDRLRSRSLGRKRSMAEREFALGLEALERFCRREPLYRVHECVFGVLAMESEPVDPRL